MNFILQKGKQIASFADPKDAERYLEDKIEREARTAYQKRWDPENYERISKQISVDFQLIAGEKEVQWEAPEGTQIENKNHRTKEKFTELLCQMQKIIGYRWETEVIDVVEESRIKQRLLVYPEDNSQDGTLFSLDALYAEYRNGTEPEDIARTLMKVAKQKERYVVEMEGQAIASFADENDARDFLFWIKKPQRFAARASEITKMLEENGVLNPNEWDDAPALLEPYLPGVRAEVDRTYQMKEAQAPDWRQPVMLLTENGVPIAGFVSPKDAADFVARKKRKEHNNQWKRWVDAVLDNSGLKSVNDIPEEETKRMGAKIEAEAEFKYGLRMQKPTESSLKTLDWEVGGKIPAAVEKTASEDKENTSEKEKTNRERPTRKGR